MSKCKLGLYQMDETIDKDLNYKKVEELINKASLEKVDIISLPEMWTSTCNPKLCLRYGEEEKGETYNFLSNLAKKYSMYIVGGTYPTKNSNNPTKINNTCQVFDRDGKCIYQYNKIHLFDVEIPTATDFKESSFTNPGDSIGTFETEFGTMGIAICYDLRFPNSFIKMAQMGAKVIFVPAAFSVETGKSHWDILTKARAIDSLSFITAISPSTNKKSSYVTYGHSKVVGPWGDVKGCLQEEEGLLVMDIDLEEVDETRIKLPSLTQSIKNID